MPCNMTMASKSRQRSTITEIFCQYSQRPNAWIIAHKLRHKVSVRPQTMDITPLRIARSHGIHAVIRPDALAHHIQILSMDVHRMSEGNVVLPYDPDSLVTTEVEDIPLWIIRVRSITIEGAVQERVVVIRAEGLPVHFVVGMACGVDGLRDLDDEGDVWRGEFDGIVGLC